MRSKGFVSFAFGISLLVFASCGSESVVRPGGGGQGDSPGGSEQQGGLPGGPGGGGALPEGPSQPGIPGQCQPKSCEDLGKECGGEVDDGCGGKVTCPSCAAGQTCDDGTCKSTQPAEHSRADNPFKDCTYYLNPNYAASVQTSVDKVTDRGLKEKMARVKQIPTAVWLDQIATIEGTEDRLGIEGHLDAALRQSHQHPNKPLLIAFVIYDLPNRDCAALASNGELQLNQDGMNRYKQHYIDKIVEKLKKPEYSKLRIAAIIEPDSLPNIVTNSGSMNCTTETVQGYKEGVAYAVSKLSALPNVYLYLDIANSAWLGWEDNLNKAGQLYQEVMRQVEGGQGLERIQGFVTNVSNYVPVQERAVDQSMVQDYYQYNPCYDEQTFVQRLKGLFAGKRFVIDTSRNGWKDAAGRRDQRDHRGNWCNIEGAGMGERPKAAPAAGIDAYFWIKPPGESDGTSNRNAKRFDAMCGPGELVRFYSDGQPIPTNSLANAPEAGQWFHEQFVMLARNATPPL